MRSLSGDRAKGELRAAGDLGRQHHNEFKVRFFNPQWDNPAIALKSRFAHRSGRKGALTLIFRRRCRSRINKLVNYDQVIIVGPVFPAEVVGSPAATSISSRCGWEDF